MTPKPAFFAALLVFGAGASLGCEDGCPKGSKASGNRCVALTDDAAMPDGEVGMCTPGETADCRTTCGSTGQGRCERDGTPAEGDACTPPAETCNHADDDCDGIVDDDLWKVGAREFLPLEGQPSQADKHPIRNLALVPLPNGRFLAIKEEDFASEDRLIAHALGNDGKIVGESVTLYSEERDILSWSVISNQTDLYVVAYIATTLTSEPALFELTRFALPSLTLVDRREFPVPENSTSLSSAITWLANYDQLLMSRIDLDHNVWLRSVTASDFADATEEEVIAEGIWPPSDVATGASYLAASKTTGYMHLHKGDSTKENVLLTLSAAGKVLSTRTIVAKGSYHTGIYVLSGDDRTRDRIVLTSHGLPLRIFSEAAAVPRTTYTSKHPPEGAPTVAAIGATSLLLSYTHSRGWAVEEVALRDTAWTFVRSWSPWSCGSMPCNHDYFSPTLAVSANHALVGIGRGWFDDAEYNDASVTPLGCN